MAGGDDAALQEIAELFRKFGPGFTCLRRGNDDFVVVAHPIAAPEGGPTEAYRRLELLLDRAELWPEQKPVDSPELFAKAICRRCGMSEEHFLPTLAAADAPVPDAGRNE